MVNAMKIKNDYPVHIKEGRMGNKTGSNQIELPGVLERVVY